MPNKDPTAYREYMRRYMRHRRRLEWLVHPSRRRTAILAREGANPPDEVTQPKLGCMQYLVSTVPGPFE